MEVHLNLLIDTGENVSGSVVMICPPLGFQWLVEQSGDDSTTG
jgi:hypothetical protein